MTVESKFYFSSKGKNQVNYPLNNNGCAKITTEKPQVPVFINKNYLDNKRRMKKTPFNKDK
jgi:hypothetical protein